MATKPEPDGSKLSCYHKILIASSIVKYWSAKEKALAIGRLKSTRSPKFFETFDGTEVSDHQARSISYKISAYANREHYHNMAHLLKSDPFLADRNKFNDIETVSYRTRITVPCSNSQMVQNTVLRIINEHSNVNSADLSRIFLMNQYNGFAFNTDSNGFSSYDTEIELLEQFIVKLKNTIALVDKVAPLVSQFTPLEDYGYGYGIKSKDQIKIKFIFDDASEPSACKILNSKVEVGKGLKVVASQDSAHSANQAAINAYVSNLARRRV